MRIDRLALFSFVSALSLCATSPCWAGESDPFGSFPESCATQAAEQYYPLKDFRAKHPGGSGQGYLFYDGASTAAQHLSTTISTELDLRAPVGTLLYDGMSNTDKPRISNQASRRAVRIGEAYDSDAAVRLYPPEPGVWAFSKKKDHFKCISDTCPQGASCTTLDLRNEGATILAALPVLRMHVTKIFRWASSVKKFRSRATRLEQAYDRNEAKLKVLAAGMPAKVIVIDVIVPIS